MMMEPHELPGFLVWIIIILSVALVILALAFLGYLPSPLTTKLDAHDMAARRADRAGLITCGLLMEEKRGPAQAVRCFDDDDPRNLFLGAR